jgi:hypothetical protein
MNTKKKPKKQPEKVLPPDEEDSERIDVPEDIEKKPEYGGSVTSPSRETLKVVGNQQGMKGKQNPFGINSKNTPKRKTSRVIVR